MKPPSLNPSETQETIRFVAWLRQCGFLCHHSTNEGKRRPKSARIAQLMGQSPGFPDVVIFDPPKDDIPGVMVEMKPQDGGIQSDEQKQWQRDLTHLRWIYILAHGAQDAINQVSRLYR